MKHHSLLNKEQIEMFIKYEVERYKKSNKEFSFTVFGTIDKNGILHSKGLEAFDIAMKKAINEII